MDKKYILIVEDNFIAQKIAKNFFELLGCKVDCVDDGAPAIALAKGNSYDGICMDIGLPTVNGIEACKAIRLWETNNNRKKVPIIAVTANARPEEIEQYIKAGMQDVFSKPLTMEKAEEFLSLCD